MTQTVVFYSAIKPPDAAGSTGISRVAGLMIEALKAANFRVETPDLPQTYDGLGNTLRQRALRECATEAANLVIANLRERRVLPVAWVSYHCYYKSPDVIGPAASQALGCAYVVAEGSFAAKRATGPWAEHHQAASEALAGADVLLASTLRDRLGLQAIPGRKGAIVDFPPFVDCARFSSIERKPGFGPVRISTAGSMNDPRKIESYRRLFKAVLSLPPRTATLSIAGDGSFRSQLELEAAHLSKHGISVSFLGQLSQASMPEFFAKADIFAWPGVGEAYGLIYLEAQAAGVPVVAENNGGVAACVRDGTSGFLVDTSVYGDALQELVNDANRRQAFGRTARAWVMAERSLAAAAERLRRAMLGVEK
jgi:glycosyltransferase involved in cell wall biosynthesis